MDFYINQIVGWSKYEHEDDDIDGCGNSYGHQ